MNTVGHCHRPGDRYTLDMREPSYLATTETRNTNHQPTIQILQGNCLQLLKSLPDQSVHCAISSPPYWQKRSYQTVPEIWGGDPKCQHDWSDAPTAATKLARGGNTSGEYGGGVVDSSKVYANTVSIASGQTCKKCGAWLGELGHEPTPGAYVHHLTQICREIYRVLRDDGIFWLNLSDTFISGGTKRTGRNDANRRNAWGRFGDGRWIERHAAGDRELLRMQTSLPTGSLAGIPWRVAIALQDQGWILRDDIIWAKPSAMPESVKNRPTYSHEYVFLLTKSMDYFYDQDAIREECVSGNGKKQGLVQGKRFGGRAKAGGLVLGFGNRLMVNPKNGRNCRDVWTIAAQPFGGAHCAPMPQKLAARCILAGTAERGCCSGCGEPWQRAAQDSSLWVPGCDCDLAAIPCTVLDPFAGACTTLLAAALLGRSATGIELNPAYCQLGATRVFDRTGITAEIPQ